VGNIGDAISGTVPSVGDAETAASTSVSSILSELKSRLESKVSPAEMDINASLSMATYPLMDLGYAEFIDQVAADPAEPMALYVKQAGGVQELFFQDNASNIVQITAAGVLNGAALGGITGAGYGSGGVALNWNAAGSNYQLKSGSGTDDYASATVNQVQLRDGSSHHVALASPSLAASYTMTFPAAAAAGLMTVDGSGNMAFETTIPDDLTLSGANTLSGTVDLQNVMSTSGSGRVSLTDWADLAHGVVSVNVPMVGAIAGNWSTGLEADGVWFSNTAGSTYLLVPICGLDSTMIIESFRVYAVNSWATTDIRYSLVEVGTDGVETEVSGWAVLSGLSDQWITVDNGDYQVVQGNTYYIKVSYDSSGDSGDATITAMEFTYTRV
jgi:hypothetical protein